MGRGRGRGGRGGEWEGEEKRPPRMRSAARRGDGHIRRAAGRWRESAEAAGKGGEGLSWAELSTAERRDEALGRLLAV